MKKLLLLLLIVLVSVTMVAQKTFKRNILYAELLGNGLFLSANYERQLSDKPGFGLHIGISLGGDKPAIPLGVKYLFRLGKQKSFIETGIGVSLAERNLWDDKNYIQAEKNPYKPGFIPSVGYRHQTPYGLMWRVNFTPVFTTYRNFSFFGVSVGWSL